MELGSPSRPDLGEPAWLSNPASARRIFGQQRHVAAGPCARSVGDAVLLQTVGTQDGVTEQHFEFSVNDQTVPGLLWVPCICTKAKRLSSWATATLPTNAITTSSNSPSCWWARRDARLPPSTQPAGGERRPTGTATDWPQPDVDQAVREIANLHRLARRGSLRLHEESCGGGTSEGERANLLKGLAAPKKRGPLLWEMTSGRAPLFLAA